MQLIRLVVILAVNFPLGTLGAPASAPVAGAVAVCLFALVCVLLQLSFC